VFLCGTVTFEGFDPGAGEGPVGRMLRSVAARARKIDPGSIPVTA
jgi:hypothetical protein